MLPVRVKDSPMPLPGVRVPISPRNDSPDPYWDTTDGETACLFHGPVLHVLRGMPSKSVQCVVTSPPYWGLREYGPTKRFPSEELARQWSKSETRRLNREQDFDGTVRYSDRGSSENPDGSYSGRVSIECLWDNEEWSSLGGEDSPDCRSPRLERGFPLCGKCFVCHLVEVFRELRRVLRDDGTLWLNLGDSYSNTGKGKAGELRPGDKQGTNNGSLATRRNLPSSPFPSGNLLGMPWRVALALQSDGWILRQDVIWSKPSPMPESVRNRCTKAHEYVFLLTKSMRYYYDATAIKEVSIRPWNSAESTLAVGGEGNVKNRQLYSSGERRTAGADTFHPNEVQNTSNKRSVWSIDDHLALLQWLQENYPDAAEEFLAERGTLKDVWRISPRGYAGAHYATFPPALVEPCVKAGTSEKGACSSCGAPWKRITEETKLQRERPRDYVKRQPKSKASRQSMDDEGYDGHRTLTGLRSYDSAMNSCANSVAGVNSRTIGWEPTCECYEGYPTGFGPPVVPCVVGDMFVGSGTTLCVALALGRQGVGIDLSEQYLRNNAIPRIEGELLSRPVTARLVRRKVESLLGPDGEWIG